MDYIKKIKDLISYYLKKILEDKKLFRITIGIICLFIIIISMIIYVNTDNSSSNHNNDPIVSYQLNLFGLEEMEIYQGEEYVEPGYYAFLNGEIVTDEVKVNNLVNTNKVGTYQVIYSIGDVKKIRTIKVIEKKDVEETINLKLELIGSEKIVLNVGDKYQELGAVAYNNNLDISNSIRITGNVDTSKSGTYYITYGVNYNNQTKSIKREVVVKEVIVKEELVINVNYSKEYTNSYVLVNIDSKGSDFSYIKLPDGSISKNKKTTYKVVDNGEYYFYVFDTNNNYKMQSIKITNIDKTSPTGTCTAKVYTDKTEIKMNAYDNVGISKYVYNNNYQSTNPNYTISKKLDNVSVIVYDKSGNSKNIPCQIEKSSIEMHFIAGISDDDAILIRTNDKTIMIDGGQYGAKDKIVSYLKDLGVKKIDALIGSHVHWNHVQAHAAILDNFQVDKVYYPVDIFKCVSLSHCKSDDVKYVKDKLISKNITPTILKPKDYLEIGEMKLYFIGPTRGIYTTYQNANSLVFILKYGNNKFMFTGDTPSEYMDTTKFQNNAAFFNMNIDVDFLKFPHHGYENLTDAFFKATTPKYAILPNCCYCSSKYPSSTNKNLMKEYNTTYYQVCDSKNIVLLSDGDNITIKTKQSAIDYKR